MAPSLLFGWWGRVSCVQVQVGFALMSLFRAKIVCVSQLELSHHDHDQIHHWLFQVHWQVQLEDFNLNAVQVHVHDLCDAAILRPLLMLATHSVAFVRPAHASYLTPNPDPF